MKVVFLEEVEGTARVGDVKNVADGFARNYLLPRRLAAPATEHYISIAQAKAEKEARRQARLDEEARKFLLPKFEGRAINIEVRVGEQGKLFGSVTARDVAEALQEATGVELEHRQVDLSDPIRELGSREVTVRLTGGVHAQVTVNVEPLGGPVVEEAPQPEAETAEGQAEPEIEESALAADEDASEVEGESDESGSEPQNESEESDGETESEDK